MTKTTIIINSKDQTIEVTKAFAKAASIFGSPEYRMLQEARRDNKDYGVKVMHSRKKDDFSGLTKETMRNYIAKHDDAEGSKMMEFRTLLGEVEANAENMEFVAKADFFEVKKWFLATFPEIKDYAKSSQNKIQAILNKVA